MKVVPNPNADLDQWTIPIFENMLIRLSLEQKNRLFWQSAKFREHNGNRWHMSRGYRVQNLGSIGQPVTEL